MNDEREREREQQKDREIEQCASALDCSDALSTGSHQHVIYQSSGSDAHGDRQ